MTGKEKPKAPAKATDTPEGERIAKVLSRAGIASRREAERLIELGEVKVNGKTITSPALNVTAKDRITVRGEPVGQPEPARLWLYYKPEGLVTSASDEKGRDTVFDIAGPRSGSVRSHFSPNPGTGPSAALRGRGRIGSDSGLAAGCVAGASSRGGRRGARCGPLASCTGCSRT